MDAPELRLTFDAAEIKTIAARYSYPKSDRVCRAAGSAARKRRYYTLDEFCTLCEWKTPRQRGRVRSNRAATVEAATRQALAKRASERERVQALISLNGVGLPTASVLLHFAFPRRYPIIDFRALESLGVAQPSSYSTRFWEDYAAACRAIAAEHGVTIRELDKALWQHSKERQQAR